jgi:hypothetical protein
VSLEPHGSVQPPCCYYPQGNEKICRYVGLLLHKVDTENCKSRADGRVDDGCFFFFFFFFSNSVHWQSNHGKHSESYG